MNEFFIPLLFFFNTRESLSFFWERQVPSPIININFAFVETKVNKMNYSTKQRSSNETIAILSFTKSLELIKITFQNIVLIWQDLHVKIHSWKWNVASSKEEDIIYIFRVNFCSRFNTNSKEINRNIWKCH